MAAWMQTLQLKVYPKPNTKLKLKTKTKTKPNQSQCQSFQAANPSNLEDDDGTSYDALITMKYLTWWHIDSHYLRHTFKYTNTHTHTYIRATHYHDYSYIARNDPFTCWDYVIRLLVLRWRRPWAIYWLARGLWTFEESFWLSETVNNLWKNIWELRQVLYKLIRKSGI